MARERNRDNPRVHLKLVLPPFPSTKIFSLFVSIFAYLLGLPFPVFLHLLLLLNFLGFT